MLSIWHLKMQKIPKKNTDAILSRLAFVNVFQHLEMYQLESR